MKQGRPVAAEERAPSMAVAGGKLPRRSLHEQVVEEIGLRIVRGDFGEAGMLPTEPRLAAELFKAMAGVNIVRVNYRGTGPALIGLVSGEVQLSFASPGGTITHIKAGRVRAVAVASARPSALFPSLPTVAESGLPGYEYSAAYAVFAPARTAEAIVKRLTREFVSVLQQPDVRSRLLQNGVEPVGSSPAQLTDKMRYDVDRLGTMIRKLGLGST